ncbi:MAG: hypothetical protein P8Z37_02235 [Acidobacteriota bacterium]
MKDKEFIRILKSEQCPPGVLKRVNAEIRRSQPSLSGRRLGVSVATAAAAAILLILALINFSDEPQVKERIANYDAADNTLHMNSDAGDYAQQAEELRFVLAYIGLKMELEAERNRDIILRSTVPAVKESIEDTEKYINNRIWGKKLL